MKEIRPVTLSSLRGRESRRAQRIRILATLTGICRQIGRLQQSEEGRLACREVARMLERALEKETRPKARDVKSR